MTEANQQTYPVDDLVTDVADTYNLPKGQVASEGNWLVTTFRGWTDGFGSDVTAHAFEQVLIEYQRNSMP